MAVSEQRRHRLYKKLEEVPGQDEAEALTEHFPPSGWNDVVRKHDLDAAVATLRAEMHEQIGGVNEKIGGLHAQIGDLRGEVHEQIGGVRAEMYEQIGGVQAQIGEMRTQMRSLFLSLVGLQITGAGMAIAVARFI